LPITVDREKHSTPSVPNLVYKAARIAYPIPRSRFLGRDWWV